MELVLDQRRKEIQAELDGYLSEVRIKRLLNAKELLALLQDVSRQQGNVLPYLHLSSFTTAVSGPELNEAALQPQI